LYPTPFFCLKMSNEITKFNNYYLLQNPLVMPDNLR